MRIRRSWGVHGQQGGDSSILALSRTIIAGNVCISNKENDSGINSSSSSSWDKLFAYKSCRNSWTDAELSGVAFPSRALGTMSLASWEVYVSCFCARRSFISMMPNMHHLAYHVFFSHRPCLSLAPGFATCRTYPPLPLSFSSRCSQRLGRSFNVPRRALFLFRPDDHGSVCG